MRLPILTIMNFLIKRQESYSKGELLLRSIFGWLYILIPHYFAILFYSIGFIFSRIATFFTILFTGKFPKRYFDFQVKVIRYMTRLNCTFFNMLDGYPSFSLHNQDPRVVLTIEYKEKVGVGRLLVRAIFAGLLLIPNTLIFVFRLYATFFVSITAWFGILFTGKFPGGMFVFMEGTMRWGQRLNNYQYFYYDNYPPFTGRVVDGENTEIPKTPDEHLITEE